VLTKRSRIIESEGILFTSLYNKGGIVEYIAETVELAEAAFAACKHLDAEQRGMLEEWKEAAHFLMKVRQRLVNTFLAGYAVNNRKVKELSDRELHINREHLVDFIKIVAPKILCVNSVPPGQGYAPRIAPATIASEVVRILTCLGQPVPPDYDKRSRPDPKSFPPPA
jgi:hypothetical protein